MDAVLWVEVGLLCLLGMAAYWYWQDFEGGPAVKWWALGLGLLSTSSLLWGLAPHSTDGASVAWIARIAVAGIVLFPYFLFEMGGSLYRRWRIVEVLVGLASLGAAAWTLALPATGTTVSFPRTYIIQVGTLWLGLSLAGAVLVWLSGGLRPELARKRRGLALGILAVGASSWFLATPGAPVVVLDVPFLTALVTVWTFYALASASGRPLDGKPAA